MSETARERGLLLLDWTTPSVYRRTGGGRSCNLHFPSRSLVGDADPPLGQVLCAQAAVLTSDALNPAKKRRPQYFARQLSEDSAYAEVLRGFDYSNFAHSVLAS